VSGNPAFQGSAFQKAPAAFQSGLLIVAGDYSLGSPAFAIPTVTTKYAFTVTSYSLGALDIPLVGRTVQAINVNPYTIAPLGWSLTPPSLHFNYHFTAAAYAVASPVFARPTLLAAGNLIPLHVNPYSLSSPVSANPTLRQVQHVHLNAYAVASPDFGAAHIAQNYHLVVNAWAVGALGFTTPAYFRNNYRFTSAAYSLGGLIFAPPAAPINVNHTFSIDSYWLESPWPGHPRLSWEFVGLRLPPTYRTQAEDAANMLRDLLNLILKSIPPQQTTAGDQVRRLVGILRDNAEVAVRGETLGTDLQNIYLAADTAGASFLGMDAVRKFLMSQVASTSLLTQAIYRSALVMTLAEMSKIITRTKFGTQTRIQNMIIYMRDAYDAAKATGINEVDVLVYQTLNAMGGALMNHLGRTELQLPRQVTYTSGLPMPSLYLANRIYADASRSDELEAQNDVVHPAFMPRIIRCLSDVGRT